MNEIKLHYLQMALVQKLVFVQELSFNKLLTDGIESEHMNYHLKKLIEYKLVEKTTNGYRLTNKGKEFSNLLDDSLQHMEKQPKSSILIRGIRENDGRIEHLLSRRLRHPFMGKVGRITGKVQFGESFKEAAERELFEETGLIAQTLILEEIQRIMRRNENEEVIHDVIFYTFFATDFRGSFVEKTEHQENLWLTKDEIFGNPNVDAYDDLEIEDRLGPKEFVMSELTGDSEGY